MISFETVRRLVEMHWAATFTVCPTRYPRSELSNDQRPAWAEIWITSGDSLRHRSGGRECFELSVTVHLFVRDGDSPATIEAIVDAAKASLHQREILGDDVRVSLRQLSIRDLSREIEPSACRLRHVVVIARGIADEICAITA